MAVGFNNVDVNAASKYGVAVGNTPVSLNLTVFDFRSLLQHQTPNLIKMMFWFQVTVIRSSVT